MHVTTRRFDFGYFLLWAPLPPKNWLCSIGVWKEQHTEIRTSASHMNCADAIWNPIVPILTFGDGLWPCSRAYALYLEGPNLIPSICS